MAEFLYDYDLGHTGLVLEGSGVLARFGSGIGESDS